MSHAGIWENRVLSREKNKCKNLSQRVPGTFQSIKKGVSPGRGREVGGKGREAVQVESGSSPGSCEDFGFYSK